MNRRKFILGMGAASAGGAAVLGSGAFSSVEADRLAEVDVVTDDDAYLGISADDNNLENGEYAEQNGNTLEVVMDSDNDSVDGGGVNPEAVTVAKEVFKIQNQGTQDITVDFEGPAGDPVVFPEEDLFVFLLPDDASLPFPLELGNGDSQTISVIAAAFDELDASNIGDVDEAPETEYTITAEVN